MPEIPRSASYDAEACIAEIKVAHALSEVGDQEGAHSHYRAALALNPTNSLLHDDFVYLLSFHPGFSDEMIARELAEWERAHAARFLETIKTRSKPTDLNQRLKIGYVSPEFWRQAESHFVIPLLEAHDHGRFEIHCYSSVEKPDDRTQQIRKLADVWHEVTTLSDEALAEKIAGDGIDVLVDLSMHMRHSRMMTFARKPAPVQVAWLAYPGSTGLATIDYRLSDRYFDPPERKSPFVERPWRLADCWICYDPLAQSALAPPRKAGPITFGSLNHPRKMNDVNLRFWATLMKRVDGSRIILHLISEEHRKRASGIFQSEGIAADRIEFVGWQARWEYLRTYDRMDVALDTLPYCGITTTCDAIWMGTPVVTLVGQTIASRGGLSILSTIGLPELVARTAEEFIQIAADLARDRARLAEYRKTLRRRIESSPVMDRRRFAAGVEEAYRAMIVDAGAK